MESSMQCLPLDALTTATPIPPNHTHTLTTTATTTSENDTLPSSPDTTLNTPTERFTTPSLAVREDKGTSGSSPHLVLSLSVVGSTLVLTALGILVACCLHQQAKKRKERRASLLPIEGEATIPLLIQQHEKDVLYGNDSALMPAAVLSTCTLRKSRLSLTSLSSKCKVQENEGMDSGLECEDDTIPRVLVSAETLRTDNAPQIFASQAADASDAVPRSEADCYSDAGMVISVTNPVGTNPRISIDSGCYDYEPEADLSIHKTRTPHHSPLQSANLVTPQCPRPQSINSYRSSQGAGVQSTSYHSSQGGGVQSAKDSYDLEPLFANWKPSMCHSRVSPAMQRPMTMGGFYNTGHHPQHHRNRSHGNNHQGSLTSSYGTGTSTRTSARTSRSTSQQTGSISCDTGSIAMGSSSGVVGSVGCGSGVFGTAARHSKTPSQSQEANKLERTY